MVPLSPNVTCPVSLFWAFTGIPENNKHSQTASERTLIIVLSDPNHSDYESQAGITDFACNLPASLGWEGQPSGLKSRIAVPSGMSARKGGAGASSLLPCILSLPRSPSPLVHQNFMLKAPSGPINPGPPG
jgi:hypothetical protein